MRTPEDVDSLLRCGADKVSVNTAAINDPTLISRVAERFGNQVLVLSVDARRERGEQHTQSGFEVTTMGGRKSTGIDALWWARRAEELGAGEVLLNSMDADGTQQGFDLEMIRAMREVVSIPIIASGGAGKAQDFPPAIAGRRGRRTCRINLPLRQGYNRRGQGRVAPCWLLPCAREAEGMPWMLPRPPIE